MKSRPGTLRHIPAAGWASLIGSVALAALCWAAILAATAQPVYVVALTADDPTEVMRASDRLDRYGIDWTIRDNGRQLAVSKSELSRAKAILSPPRRARTSEPSDATLAKQGRLQRMLDRVLGPGRATVAVDQRLDRDLVRRDKLGYARRGTPARWAREAQSLDGTDVRWRRRSGSTDWAVGRQVTRTRVAPGALMRQTVALVFDRTVPRRTVAELRRAIGTAAGVNRRRGDELSVARMRMPRPKVAKPEGALELLALPRVKQILARGRWIALGAGFAIFLVAAARAVRREQSKPLVRVGEPDAT